MICKIVSNMLGETHEKIDDQVIDAVGEIANMVAGGAKASAQEKEMGFNISLPNVTVGEKHSHAVSSEFPTVVVPFTTDHGDFTIEVCVKASK